MTTLTPDLLSRLIAVVGAENTLVGEDVQAPYEREPRGLYHKKAAAVVRPASVEEVSALMRLAYENALTIIPQGGNTGTVGGQVPFSGGEIILSLQRLNRVRDIDLESNTMTLEAGVTLQQAQDSAEQHGRLFPLSLPSEKTCTIGGNLATNAGGTAVLAYGSMRDLTLGVEAVLADGSLLRTLRKVRKDNTGYDLKDLLIGSEGTLGIITAATVRLFPRPRAKATAFVGLASVKAAAALLQHIQAETAGCLATFELLPRFALDLQLKHHAETRDPLTEQHAWYVLLEVTSAQKGTLEDALNASLSRALKDGMISEAVQARTAADRAALWAWRERTPSVQGLEGGSIKHDISIPLASLTAFLDEAKTAVTSLVPACRLLPFGHLGDGNIHYNVMQPEGMDRAAFLARWGDMNALVHTLVTRYDGSIAAEHGVGQMKREALAAAKDRVTLDVMRKIKQALDPKGILNPGKVV